MCVLGLGVMWLAGTGRGPLKAAAQTGAVPALPAACARAFAEVHPDRPPPEIIRSTHYVISNEDKPHLFHEAAQGLGGVLVGVGSEQNYMFAGWARPEVLVLMDFDQVIVDLHRVYRVLFLNAPDPAAFIALWADDREAEVLGLLSAAYPNDKAAPRAYRIARSAVRKRLAKLLRIGQHSGVHSFIDDPAQYAAVVGLFRAGRVVPVRGDLAADRTVRDIGVAATRCGLPVRLLYLSNAERYFPYNDAFKTGMLGLPMDERSLVLRTTARRDGSYEYLVQPGAAFQAWLRRPGTESVMQMKRWREHDSDADLGFIRKTPADLKRARP